MEDVLHAVPLSERAKKYFEGFNQKPSPAVEDILSSVNRDVSRMEWPKGDSDEAVFADA